MTMTITSRDRLEACFRKHAVDALPSFGNLYVLQVNVDRAPIEDDHMVFPAGPDIDATCIPYAECARLVKPAIVAIARNR